VEFSFVAADSADPARPGNEVVESRQLSDGERIVFTQVVQVVQKPVFLVWKNKEERCALSDGKFAVEHGDERNRRFGDYRRFSARYDEVSERWFVPLVEIIETPVDEIDSTVNHRLLIELTHQSGEFKRVLLSFRVAGPIPKLRIEQELVSSQNSAGEVVESLRGGRRFFYLEVTNPGKKAVSVSVRSSNSALTLTSEQGSTEYIPAPKSCPSFTTMPRVAQDSFPLSTKVLFRLEGGVEQDGDQVFLIPAGGTAVFSWVLLFEKNIPELRSSKSTDFIWATANRDGRTYCVSGGEQVPRPTFSISPIQSMAFSIGNYTGNQVWDWRRAVFDGAIDIELTVSDPAGVLPARVEWVNKLRPVPN
jgi:hypothetical protein